MKLAVWGVEASPYLLKIEALLKYSGADFRRLPRDGGRLENLLAAIRLRRARRQRRVQRYPRMDPLDEYPSVPYLLVNDRSFHYDSSSIAQWLDDEVPVAAPPCYPPDPALAFIARLIDEAFDEYGLYMVHHQRWVCSAVDTTMGEVTANEMSRLLPPPFSSLVRRRRRAGKCGAVLTCSALRPQATRQRWSQAGCHRPVPVFRRLTPCWKKAGRAIWQRWRVCC